MKSHTMAWTTKAKAAREAGSNQQQIVQTQGPCHVHAWNAVLSYIAKEHASDAVIQDKTEAYKTHVSTLGPDTESILALLGEDVRFCLMAKTHSSEFKRLEVGFATDSHSRIYFMTVVRPALMSTKGSRALVGMAPPGDLERTLQRYLDDLKA